MERPLGADRPAAASAAAGVALLQPAADVAQLGVVQAAAAAAAPLASGLLLQLHRVQALDGTSARYKTSAQVYTCSNTNFTCYSDILGTRCKCHYMQIMCQCDQA